MTKRRSNSDWLQEDEETIARLQWAELDGVSDLHYGPRHTRDDEARDCALILNNLHEVRKRVEARVGKMPVSGRYHRLPRRLEDDYKVTRKVLGKGASGEVRLALRLRSTSDRRYAVKCFRLSGIPRKRRLELEAEVEVYLSVDHPHIARLRDVYESESHLYLVMECMEGGELLDRLNEVEQFAEKDAAECVYQMLLSINYLHSLDIIHRDIKADNFLFDTLGGKRLKLIDFGLCAVWEKGIELAEVCGTLSYVAPEVLQKCYTSQCDLWSLGVIAYQLLSGSLPFKAIGSFTNQMAAIEKGSYEFKGRYWSAVSDEAKGFIRGLLEMDPRLRFDAEAALRHQWLARRTSRVLESKDLDPFVVRGLRKFGLASALQRAAMSLMAWSISNDESEVFRKNFLLLDKSQNGRITFPELMEALREDSCIAESNSTAKSTGSVVSTFGEMLRIFASLDANNDWRIQYTDFLAAMMSHHIENAKMRNNPLDHLLQDAFDRFDVDRSGDISAEDLEHVLNMSNDEARSAISEVDVLGHGCLSYAAFEQHVAGQQAFRRSSL